MFQVIEKHFVIFYSPGMLFGEQSTREIEAWDARKAVAMSAEIRERYSAVPYGFRFITRAIAPDMPDGHGGTIRGGSSEVASSPMHFIGGTVETLDQVEARNDPSERILRENMRCNGYLSVVTTHNSWKHTAPFMDGAINLDREGNVLEVAPTKAP